MRGDQGMVVLDGRQEHDALIDNVSRCGEWASLLQLSHSEANVFFPHRPSDFHPVLRQCIPGTAPAAVEGEMALCDQLAEVLLQCVSACACQFYNVADCYSSVLMGVLNDA